MLQIAAFRKREDADKLNDLLISKGLIASIYAVQQPEGMWYRVSMGPYESKIQAELVQESIFKMARVKGMIRTVDN